MISNLDMGIAKNDKNVEYIIGIVLTVIVGVILILILIIIILTSFGQ